MRDSKFDLRRDLVATFGLDELHGVLLQVRVQLPAELAIGLWSQLCWLRRLFGLPLGTSCSAELFLGQKAELGGRRLVVS